MLRPLFFGSRIGCGIVFPGVGFTWRGSNASGATNDMSATCCRSIEVGVVGRGILEGGVETGTGGVSGGRCLLLNALDLIRGASERANVRFLLVVGC